MAGPKTALYAAGLTCLGFICFALASTAVGVPIWGYYDNPTGKLLFCVFFISSI